MIIEGERDRLKEAEKEGERREGVCAVALEMFSQPDCINICVPSCCLSPYV